MNDNYKFLGTISAVCMFANADENYYITLAVFCFFKNLKIYFKDLAISGNSQSTNEREIILDDISKIECSLIAEYFDEELTKKTILAKICLKTKMYPKFEIIY